MISRPVLRYYGGKYRLASWIVGHFPQHRVYVEPFAGAASVLLRKPRANVEVYNDLDHRVVLLFRVLRDRSEELKRVAELTPYSREEWDSTWLEDSGNEIEDCRRFLLRSWGAHGCSGSVNRNHTGFRRTPKGRNGGSHPAMDWANWPEVIPMIADRLRGVVIEHEDAAAVLDRYDGPDTLIYADPPYVHSSRSRPDHGYRYEMDDEAHTALIDRLKQCRGMVVLSGYRTPLYDQLLAEWDRRDVAARADGGAEKTECIWLSPAASEALGGRQERLF